MPAKFLMSWEPKQRRWDKMYKGTRYRVFCSQLDISETEWTKDGSYQAANKWWQNKLAELAAARIAIEHADRPELPALEERKAYTQRHGLKEDEQVIDAEIISIKTNAPGIDPTVDATTAARMRLAETIGIDVSGVDPTTAPLIFGSQDDVWQDRLKREQQTDPDRSIGTLARKWIADRQDEARNGIRSPTDADRQRLLLEKFVAFVGASNSADAITAGVWQRWYVHCAGMVAKRKAAHGQRKRRDDGTVESWSADTAKKAFAITRAFVENLWVTRAMAELPRNLKDKKHKFRAEAKDPANFTVEEIHQLLAAATGVHRLILLLNLNCGMYGIDVANLLKSQIDWQEGRITRRRSKTSDDPNTPKVSYKLWPETLALLRQHLNADPNEPRALTTQSGKPWVWTRTTADGKIEKSDNVATIFNNLKRKVGMTGPDKSVKVFRKTSSTLIANNPDFRGLESLFLGHAPRGMDAVHYVRMGSGVLDKAVDWLRDHYGIQKTTA